MVRAKGGKPIAVLSVCGCIVQAVRAIVRIVAAMAGILKCQYDLSTSSDGDATGKAFLDPLVSSSALSLLCYKKQDSVRGEICLR